MKYDAAETYVNIWERAYSITLHKVAREMLINNLNEAFNAGIEHAKQTPINMLLYCPVCDEQHVDAPEPGTTWDNPPHKSHQCALCATVWRHADVPTNGVKSIETKGKDDTWNPETRCNERKL